MAPLNNHWSKQPRRGGPMHGDRQGALGREAIETPKDHSIAPSADQNAPDNRQHLTTNEAADYLRLSPRSLERYRVEGTGPSYLKAGPGKRARVFYRPADLDAWLEGRVYTSTAEYNT